VPQEPSVRFNQAGSDARSRAAASPYTAPTCMLCTHALDEARPYTPVYVERWLVGYVHDDCYEARIAELLEGS
jgi:hypothetical protein